MSNVVFLSYARHDLDLAERLQHCLTDNGFTVWWDHELIAGNPFSRQIFAALKEAVAVLVLFSEHSLVSNYVKAEAAFALVDGKLVVAGVSINACSNVPAPFNEQQCQNLTNWIGSMPEGEAEIRKLITAVHRNMKPLDILLGPTNKDDTQKGRFGGSPVRNGRKLSAEVWREARRIQDFNVRLQVSPTQYGPDLMGEVEFYVDGTFSPSWKRVRVEGGHAVWELQEYADRPFTVGAICDRGATRLELDLCNNAGWG